MALAVAGWGPAHSLLLEKKPSFGSFTERVQYCSNATGHVLAPICGHPWIWGQVPYRGGSVCLRYVPQMTGEWLVESLASLEAFSWLSMMADLRQAGCQWEVADGAASNYRLSTLQGNLVSHINLSKFLQDRKYDGKSSWPAADEADCLQACLAEGVSSVARSWHVLLSFLSFYLALTTLK